MQTPKKLPSDANSRHPDGGALDGRTASSTVAVANPNGHEITAANQPLIALSLRRRLSRLFFVLLLVVGLSTPLHAENKKAEEAIIITVSTSELTVSRGHNVHVTYKIPKNVILSFNGLPATVADLRGGMMVTIRPDESGQVALAIRAHNAPRSMKH